MLSSTNSRFIFGVPIATGVVYGLFTLMSSLIAIDEVELIDEPQRELPIIVPQEESTTPETIRPVIKEIDTSPKPPPPPAHTVRKSDVSLPIIALGGQAPTTLNLSKRINLEVRPVAVGSRSIQPLSPPVLTYPMRAIHRNIEGDCEVHFDVDARGNPFNVVPTCSNRIFNGEAKRAIQKVKFAPEIHDGRLVERRNVV